MKTLLLIFSVLLLNGCNPKSEEPMSVSQSIETRNVRVVVNPLTGKSLKFGAITKAPNGDFIVAGVQAGLVVLSSSNKGLTWTHRKTIRSSTAPVGPQTMITIGGSIFLNALTSVETFASETQSHIYRSDDNGETWDLVLTDTMNQLMFSPVFDNLGRAAISLTHSPLAGGMGYTKAHVDFGWFDASTNSIVNVSRLASAGDEPENFPSEIFYFRRPRDGALVAGVRWGESPGIPFIKLKVSRNNGATWYDSGITWPGFAGMASACVNSKGELWAAGYLKVADYTSFTVVRKIDANSLLVTGTYYPFSQTTGIEVGNGQLYCDGNDANVFLAINNGWLTFAEVVTERAP